MTSQEERKLDLEIAKLRVDIDKTLQDLKHAPVKLYIAFGAILGAIIAKVF